MNRVAQAALQIGLALALTITALIISVTLPAGVAVADEGDSMYLPVIRGNRNVIVTGTPQPTATTPAPTPETPQPTATTPAPTASPPAGTPIATPPSGMVEVPEGTFQMGCDTDNDPFCGDDQRPLHNVSLAAYYIDKNEVTNARYKACVDAGVCTAPNPTSSATRSSYYGNAAYAQYPVLNVTWGQADVFCQWDNKRLPTEAEWEKAARGSAGTQRFPWGGAEPDCARANYDGCVGDTDQAGNRAAGASPYGLLDMSGNVWEWVSDWYDEDYYQSSSGVNPTGPETGYGRVVRGGSWYSSESFLTVTNRSWFEPGQADDETGFRCARSK